MADAGALRLRYRRLNRVRWKDRPPERRRIRDDFRGGQTAQRFTLDIDGKSWTIEVDDPEMPLLYALRDDLGLNNPRFGCGLGQCGACTVPRASRHATGEPSKMMALGAGSPDAR
jgi:2Fe-2S iron-sulfur cluster binding domain